MSVIAREVAAFSSRDDFSSAAHVQSVQVNEVQNFRSSQVHLHTTMFFET